MRTWSWPEGGSRDEEHARLDRGSVVAPAVAAVLFCWPWLGASPPRRRTCPPSHGRRRRLGRRRHADPAVSWRARAPPSTTPTPPRRCARRPAPSSRPALQPPQRGHAERRPAVRGERRPRPHLRLRPARRRLETGLVGKYVNGAPPSIPGWDSLAVHLEDGATATPPSTTTTSCGSAARGRLRPRSRPTTRSTSSATSPCGTSGRRAAVPHHAGRGAPHNPLTPRTPLRPRAGHPAPEHPGGRRRRARRDRRAAEAAGGVRRHLPRGHLRPGARVRPEPGQGCARRGLHPGAARRQGPGREGRRRPAPARQPRRPRPDLPRLDGGTPDGRGRALAGAAPARLAPAGWRQATPITHEHMASAPGCAVLAGVRTTQYAYISSRAAAPSSTT